MKDGFIQQVGTPQDIILGVRPERIEWTDFGFTGTVDASEMPGSTVHLHVNAPGHICRVFSRETSINPEA